MMILDLDLKQKELSSLKTDYDFFIKFKVCHKSYNYSHQLTRLIIQKVIYLKFATHLSFVINLYQFYFVF